MPIRITSGSFADRALRRVARSLIHRPDPPAPAPTTSPIPVLEDPEIIFPGLWQHTIQLSQCGWRWGHPFNDNALIFLCHLAAGGYRPIVEFGTFDGRTTVNLALNAGNATVTTIDLPGADDGSNVEGKLYGAYESGACIHRAPTPLRARIHQITSDSREVELADLTGTIGMVFIDGGHDAEVCGHDTAVALRVVRPGGVVIWDDYTPYWPGVYAVVNDVARERSLFHFPRHGLVVHKVPQP